MEINKSDKRELQFFSSFEEEAEFEREQARNLTPIERLQKMRMLINLAYSLPDGKMPLPPQAHTLTIVEHEYFR